MNPIPNPGPPAPRATPLPFRWVSSLLYVGMIVAHLYYQWAGLCGSALPAGQTGALVGVVLLLLALERYERAQPASKRTGLMLLAAQMVLFEVAAAFDCAGFSKFLYLIVPFTAYFYFGKQASYGLGLLYWGFLTVKLASQDPRWYVNREYISVLLIFSIGLLFAISMAGVVGEEEASRARAEKLLGELEASHRELKAYAARVAALAAAEERNRLARDIHDSLGHYLTVINVQLEKAIAFRSHDPQQADQALWDAKRSAREALRDVRQSVGALRTSKEVFSLTAALADLVDGVRNDSLTIDLQLKGDEAAFPKPALLALYRAVQEGLTNIQKHARASRVTVVVKFDEREARLRICDDGQGFDPAMQNHLPPDRQSRFGLQGLRERVELVGGQTNVESRPGTGTQLLITIPKRPLAPENVTDAPSNGAP